MERVEPENHQVMLDALKKNDILPDNSTIEDYAFLFNFEKQNHREEEKGKERSEV